jgi:hypothetical protein
LLLLFRQVYERSHRPSEWFLSNATIAPTRRFGSVLGSRDVLLEVLSMFIIAAAVGIFVAEVWELPDTVALLLVGVAVSVLDPSPTF